MDRPHSSQCPPDPLSRGHAAAARGARAEARAWFETALRQEETPEALEGLGMAASRLADPTGTFDARERAYWLYRERGDRVAAARLATWLALDSCAFAQSLELADSWLQPAHRLLAGLALTVEHGRLALAEGEIALLVRQDAVTAGRCGIEAAALGRTLELPFLESRALQLQRRARAPLNRQAVEDTGAESDRTAPPPQVHEPHSSVVERVLRSLRQRVMRGRY